MKKFISTYCFSALNYGRLSLLSFLLMLSCSVSANALEDNNIKKSEIIKKSQSIEVVNINTADAKTLATLKGVGKVKAQAIVNYRKENGNFASLSSLENVKGIGEKVLADNKNKLIL